MDDFKNKLREAVSEGVVLLKNSNHTLPLAKGSRIAIFGHNQYNYYKSGTGSGGMVHAPYVVSVLDALENEERLGNITLNSELQNLYAQWHNTHPYDSGNGWTHPCSQVEMPLTKEIVQSARLKSDIAIIMIGRTAGEDCDNSATEGSYLLTTLERQMLQLISSMFSHTIVLLNVGNIIDMSWVDEYAISSVAYIWQGGQEGGNGVVDVLMGRVSPSGKLPDTIAKNINDIPSTKTFGEQHECIYEEDIYVGYRYFETFAKERVQYPFGFGLSYTNFSITVTQFEIKPLDTPKPIHICVAVKNIGTFAGKEVVQVYGQAPQGKLGKPVRSLCAFAKTKTLQPNECEVLTFDISSYAISSYDDSNATGKGFSYVLEEGTYTFFVGSDVRSAVLVGEMNVESLFVVQKATQLMAPTKSFEILTPSLQPNENHYLESKKTVATRIVDYEKRIAQNLPLIYPITGNLGYQLKDVFDGRISMDTFIAQLSIEDLASICRGEGMCSPKVTAGIAGAFGGVTDSLQVFGIPIAGCSDGPSGIRMDCGTKAYSLPNGTLLASTFNETLCTELFEWEGFELRQNKIDTLLGPGMNIHRNPLNGRNFEYFSEDPLLTGKIAAAQLRGMHKFNVTGTIKHFACNNQETNRHGVNILVSERALREIYLKGYEIAVKEGNAYSIMTSYNGINGYWSASNYDLITLLLCGEWNFKGIVMTDWWAKGNFADDTPVVPNTAAKARAGNDLFMVNSDASDQTCDNSLEMMKNQTVSVGYYQQNAKHICEYLLKTPCFHK